MDLEDKIVYVLLYIYVNLMRMGPSFCTDERRCGACIDDKDVATLQYFTLHQ